MAVSKAFASHRPRASVAVTTWLDLVGVAAAFAVAIFTATTSIVGSLKSYSPVPFWDMWDGYLGFYLRVLGGDQSAWFAQHNEHRIFLARVLFWCDLALFGGRGLFLILVNFVLLAASVFTFWKLLPPAVSEASRRVRLQFGLLMVASLCSWVQQENIAGAFQSQFFLAQIVPLWAFFFLSLSMTTAGVMSARYFTVAMLLGVASVGTMANGLLTLPLMLVFSIVSRQSWVRAIALGTVAIILILLYFRDYSAVSAHGSLKDALVHHPLGVLRNMLAYLGNPLFHLFRPRIGLIAALAAGLVLILLSILAAIRALNSLNQTASTRTCLFFVIYVIATALITAVGRASFGVDSAFWSRYSTPVLMAWAAIAIIYFFPIANFLFRGGSLVLTLVILVVGIFLAYQVNALTSRDSETEARTLAFLALTLEIHDSSLIKDLYPDSSRAEDYTERAARNNVALFDAAPFKEIRGAMGSVVDVKSPSVACVIHQEPHAVVEGDKRYVRIAAQLGVGSSQDDHAYAIVDTSGHVVGFVLDDYLLNARYPWQRPAVGAVTKLRGYMKMEELSSTQGGNPALSCCPF